MGFIWITTRSKMSPAIILPACFALRKTPIPTRGIPSRLSGETPMVTRHRLRKCDPSRPFKEKGRP
jgi:hypothetical protein